MPKPMLWDFNRNQHTCDQKVYDSGKTLLLMENYVNPEYIKQLCENLSIQSKQKVDWYTYHGNTVLLSLGNNTGAARQALTNELRNLNADIKDHSHDSRRLPLTSRDIYKWTNKDAPRQEHLAYPQYDYEEQSTRFRVSKRKLKSKL